MCTLQFVDKLGEEFRRAINATQSKADHEDLTIKALLKIQMKVCDNVALNEQYLF